MLLGLYGCLLRAVRTGVPYGCQKLTLADRNDRPYVRAGRTVVPYGPYVRVVCTGLNTRIRLMCVFVRLTKLTDDSQRDTQREIYVFDNASMIG